MIVLVAGCLGLGWWQIGRAARGNALSFGYAFEWPVFALFVIFIWYREVRLDLYGPGGPSGRGEPSGPDEEAPPVESPPEVPRLLSSVPARRQPAERAQDADPRLRAYNEYLAWLNADPTRRPGDYPGAPPTGHGTA